MLSTGQRICSALTNWSEVLWCGLKIVPSAQLLHTQIIIIQLIYSKMKVITVLLTRNQKRRQQNLTKTNNGKMIVRSFRLICIECLSLARPFLSMLDYLIVQNDISPWIMMYILLNVATAPLPILKLDHKHCSHMICYSTWNSVYKLLSLACICNKALHNLAVFHYSSLLHLNLFSSLKFSQVQS